MVQYSVQRLCFDDRDSGFFEGREMNTKWRSVCLPFCSSLGTQLFWLAHTLDPFPKATNSDRSGCEKRVANLSHRLTICLDNLGLERNWPLGHTALPSRKLLFCFMLQTTASLIRQRCFINIKERSGCPVPLLQISLALVPVFRVFSQQHLDSLNKRGQAGRASPDKEDLCKTTGYGPR